MARNTYSVLLSTGETIRVGGYRSAKQVRTFHPEAVTVTLERPEPVRTERTRWDVNNGRDPWAGGTLAARLRAAQDRLVR